jgi:hypothetical protein
LFNFEAPLKLREKTADHRAMSTGSINNLSSSYLEALSANPVGASSQTNSSAGSIFNNAIGAAVILDPKPQTDNSQLSPFAQVLNTLQQLQQTNPTEYQQVTQQIATNLQSAAQTAQSQGNTNAANELNQLATDFTNASGSGQLPDIQDLAKALGGHHHHHHASSSGESSSASTASNGNNAANGLSQAVSQFLSELQTNSTQSNPLNPATIILNTLTSAGITSLGS